MSRTSLRLVTRIKQHVPANIRRRELHILICLTQTSLDSSIGQHWGDNPVHEDEYQVNWFAILHIVRSRYMFRFSEGVTIKLRKSPLCRKKEF